MPLQIVFARFAELLDHRISRGVYTTEDSVRYTFFHALIEAEKLHPTDVILEHPHPNISGRKKIDVLISATQLRPAIALEFKYDRNNSDHQKKRTMQAGAVVADIFRLARMPKEAAGHRHLVYLTDSEMEAYFTNPSNRLKDLIDVGAQGYTLNSETFDSFSDSFKNEIQGLATTCKILSAYKKSLSKEHTLRIFRIDTFN